MKKLLFFALLCLSAAVAEAQEKVINVQKTDGTKTQTRAADLEKISFLTTEEGGKGLLVKTVGGETAAVLFEARPVVTIADGRMTVTADTAEAMTFEIDNIAEITFGEPDPSAIDSAKQDFTLVLQDGSALLRDIPKGVQPGIYSADGRLVAAPAVADGSLRLSREMLGAGVFIVKAGKFAAKIHF